MVAGRDHIAAHDGDRFHGLCIALGPDELLGGHRDYQYVFGLSRHRPSQPWQTARKQFATVSRRPESCPPRQRRRAGYSSSSVVTAKRVLHLAKRTFSCFRRMSLLMQDRARQPSRLESRFTAFANRSASAMLATNCSCSIAVTQALCSNCRTKVPICPHRGRWKSHWNDLSDRKTGQVPDSRQRHSKP